jgi:hypothetical protein
VVFVDLFGFGETRIRDREFLFALLLQSIGSRPLGLQVGALTAVAAWCERQFGMPVELHAYGPRSSVIALVAAGLDPNKIKLFVLHESWGSLKELIETNRGVNELPEQFTFGLLAEFDLVQLAALAAPRPVSFAAPSPRVKREMQPLVELHQALGTGGKVLPNDAD